MQFSKMDWQGDRYEISQQSLGSQLHGEPDQDLE
jgi:hypothetical protein